MSDPFSVSRGRGAVLAAMLCGAALPAACSSFGAGASDAPTVGAGDAGPDAVDPGPADASADGMSPPFAKCEKERMTVVESFEEALSDWSPVVVQGAEIKLDTTVVRNGKASLKASALPSADGIQARIERRWPLVPATVDLRYAVHLEDRPRTYAEVGCAVNVADANDETKTRLVVALGGAERGLSARGAVGSDEVTTKPVHPTVDSGWYVVHQVAAFAPGVADVEVTVVAPNGVSRTERYSVRTAEKLATFDLRCGILYADSSSDDLDSPSPLDVYVDDVAMSVCLP